VGILNRQVIFVCKYHMAKKHWQIMNWNTSRNREGATEPVYIGDAPRNLLNIALKAANLIGSGLYGVDIKQVEDRFYIIEINDNPNIDHGNEDAKLHDDLYAIIMKHFFDSVLRIKGIGVNHG
jgi:glutathione synthase/RimK-type ligase-like ATP-grasp enzyme